MRYRRCLGFKRIAPSRRTPLVLLKDYAEAVSPSGMGERLLIGCQWFGRETTVGCEGFQSWSTQSLTSPAWMKSHRKNPSCHLRVCGEQVFHSPYGHTGKNLWEALGKRLVRSHRCNKASRPAFCNRKPQAGIFVDSPRLVTSCVTRSKSKDTPESTDVRPPARFHRQARVLSTINLPD